jgi:hypothetical protein
VHASVPDNARCLGCGYELRGLPEPVCPECGRAFDPGDPKTFDARTAAQRRRRLILRVLVLVAVIGLLAAIAPRGIMRSNVTLTCPDCGGVHDSVRYELKPPGWISFRYPGFVLQSGTLGTRTQGTCKNHRHNVAMSVQSRVLRACRVSGTTDPGDVCYVNEIEAIPGNGGKIIEAVIRDHGCSISCGSSSDEEFDPAITRIRD